MAIIESLRSLLRSIPEIELAILIGSRTQESAGNSSDWDIAIRWKKNISGLARLDQTEHLKNLIFTQVGISKDQIDIIDMAAIRLAMRAVIAEEGVILKGENTLAWNHFLTQTWGELEDYYWRQQHAA